MNDDDFLMENKYRPACDNAMKAIAAIEDLKLGSLSPEDRIKAFTAWENGQSAPFDSGVPRGLSIDTGPTELVPRYAAGLSAGHPVAATPPVQKPAATTVQIHGSQSSGTSALRSSPNSAQAQRTINPSAFWEERAKQQATSANSPRPGKASAIAAPAATSSVPAPRSLNPAAIYASRAEQAAAAYARGPQQEDENAPGAARSLPDPNAVYGARRGAKENRR